MIGWTLTGTALILIGLFAGLMTLIRSKIDFDSELQWQEFAGTLAGKLAPDDGGQGKWIYFNHGENNEFYISYNNSRYNKRKRLSYTYHRYYYGKL